VKWSNSDRHRVKSIITQNEVNNEQKDQEKIIKTIQAGCGETNH